MGNTGIAIIGGADGPTEAFLAGNSNAAIFGSFAAAAALLMVFAFAFAKCLRAGEKKQKMFIVGALALCLIYMALCCVKIYAAAYINFFGMWDKINPTQAETDAFIRSHFMYAMLFAGYIGMGVLLSLCIAFTALRGFMNKTAKKITFALFCIAAAVVLSGVMIHIAGNLGKPDMAFGIATAGLVFMAAVMLAKINRNGKLKDDNSSAECKE